MKDLIVLGSDHTDIPETVIGKQENEIKAIGIDTPEEVTYTIHMRPETYFERPPERSKRGKGRNKKVKFNHYNK